MRYENTLEVLRRLLKATKEQRISWRDDENDWRSTDIGDEKFNTVSSRFRYIEAEPQIGADPLFLELFMPCLNAGFFIGTEGYEILFDIHLASSGKEQDDGTEAINFLQRNGI